MSRDYSESKKLEKQLTDKGLAYVGKRIPNREAEMKAAGEIQYIDDLVLPRMLHGKILFSPHAHARIKSIDISEAETLEGVHAIIHAFNTPRNKFNSAARFYMDRSDFDMPETEFIFNETVRFVGDRVAAVAADDPLIAEKALKLIKVDYEVLPAVTTLEEAIEEGSAQANPYGIKGSNLCGGWLSYGNDDEQAVLQAIENADHVFENTFRTSRVHHGYMEPVAHIARYEKNGKLTIWTSTQNVFCFRDVLSRALGIPENKIRVIKTVCGGAFGGKLEVMHEPVVALLSIKSGRPVKIRLTRKETFSSSRSRREALLTIRSGVSKEGILMGQHVKSHLNNGAYAGSGPNTVGAQSGKTFILYNGKKMFYSGASFYSNTPQGGAMRGYGCPQIMLTRETHTDRMARELGIDPVEFRLKNVVKPHEKNCMGNNMHSAMIGQCIRKGAEAFNWKKRREAAVAYNEPGKKRGVAMDIAVHGNGWYPVYQDFTTITLRLNNDGTAMLLTGTHDLGTGSRTVLAQIAAEILTIPPLDIEVIEADTDITPFDLGAQASRTTYIGGNATILAAKDLRDELLKEASAMMDIPVEDLELSDGHAVHRKNETMNISLSDLIASAQSGKQGDQRELIATRTFESVDSVDSYAAVFSEVEVDTDSGEIKVLSLLSVHNSGKVINPQLFEGQVHGGIHMGLGYALSEEMDIDKETGKVKSDTFKKYRMFKAEDMPQIEVLTVEEPESAGPFGAKSIGECATDGVAGSIVNAVSHALGGVELNRIPLTPEYIKSVISDN